LAQHAVAGILPGDHACASFGSDEEHRALVAGYARQALRHSERLLYLAHATSEATIRGYLEAEGIDVEAAIALGQVEIRHGGHGRGPVDPEAMIGALQADLRDARRDGYSPLRVTSEMSWATDHPAQIDAVERYERAVNRVFGAADVAGVCQYDRRLLAPDVLERLTAAHDFQICTAAKLTTTARRRLTISEHDDGVIALAGALDIDSAAYLAARLAEFRRRGDVVLATSGLGFADVSGCRALVQAAAGLGEHGRLVLPEPSESLVRVLNLCGWSTNDRLVLS
jgi:anti-anti-sigma regulatory factor